MKEYRRSSRPGDGVRRRGDSVFLFSIWMEGRLRGHDNKNVSRRLGEQHAVVEDAYDTHMACGGVTRFVGASRPRPSVMGRVFESGAKAR